jgi:hypothetical protein
MKEPFQTKDWIHASILINRHIPFQGVRRNGNTCHFLFTDSKQSEELIESFLRGDLRVNLRDFVDAQRRVKDLIFKQANTNQI